MEAAPQDSGIVLISLETRSDSWTTLVRECVTSCRPLEGLKIGGKGFSKGLAKGTASLMSNTVDGTFDAARCAERSLQNGQNMRRVRRPRVFGRYNELKCYKEADTIAYELLKRVGVCECAADLTREARDRRRSGSNGSGKLKSNDSTRERTNSLRRALQEDDERRRAAGELPNAGTGETSGRKLRYEVVFYTRDGMDLETDFYCENVTIKAMDETSRSKVKVRGHIASGQQVLQEGDCLLGVGGVDVRVSVSTKRWRYCAVQHDQSRGRVDQEAEGPVVTLADRHGAACALHQRRIIYQAVVEWMTPLRYIYRVEWQKNAARICLHLSVGVDSLPMGPRLRPSLKAIDGHERDMNVFLDVMWHSFGSATAEEQELWPSDTSLNGYLLKKGGFSTVRRWFVLSRNCLYYFTSRKQLRGIIPLGHVRLETDAGDARCLRITNATRSQPLVTLQLDSGQVVERVQSEVVLVAASTQELEMWQSSLAHAAGKGMRHSRGTRFFVPTAASRLEIGTQETPDFVVKPLAEALKKTVEELPTTRVFWVGVAAFRLWNALFVRTSFNPDEYWQSTEVAHRLVFGYGYLTWEWQDDAQLRGFAHPALFAGLYKLLELLNLDSRWAVAYGPRLMQGLISAANDFFLYKLARNYFDAKAAKWALLCQFFSWFTFYVMVRPFSNCVETLCTTAALAYWPWKFLEDGADKKNDDAAPVKRRNRALALVLAALGVLFRPTNAIIWLYPGIVHFLQTRDHAYLMFGLVMPIAIVTTLTMLCIDRLGYGEWTFVPFNFFKFNVLEGKDKLYGEHPWSWYFSQGYPAIVGTTLPIVIAGYLTVPSSKKDLGRVIMWALFVYSNAAHKEFRFVLPLLPPAFVYAGYCLRNLERKLYVQFRERTQWNLLRLAVFSVIVPNVLSAYYLSRSHQLSAPERLDVVPGLLAGQPRANRRLRVAPT
ncbi:PH domain-like [Phytophthora cactorum]|nr:PH domain-like [Phytophthora cactorum]